MSIDMIEVMILLVLLLFNLRNASFITSPKEIDQALIHLHHLYQIKSHILTLNYTQKRLYHHPLLLLPPPHHHHHHHHHLCF